MERVTEGGRAREEERMEKEGNKDKEGDERKWWIIERNRKTRGAVGLGLGGKYNSAQKKAQVHVTEKEKSGRER